MKHKILIVEDDADTVKALKIRLKSEGFDTVCVGDGMSAVFQAQQEKPDLILLDLGLPGGTGFDVMDRFINLPEMAVIPVIVVSAYSDLVFRHKAMTGGAAAFVPKPIDNDLLIREIRKHLPEIKKEESSASRPKVVLIEDDSDTARGLLIRLGEEGYSAKWAADAVTAMGIAVKERPQLIILDLGLPGGDGLQLLNRMQQNALLSSVPVIVISARDAALNRNMCIASGAYAYFQKPPDMEEFLNAARNAIAGK